MRRANRIDANHKEIIAYAREKGFFVWDTHDLKNCCDCVMVRNGVVYFTEIKDGSKNKSATKLTDGEEKFKENLEEHKGVYLIVKSKQDIDSL